MGAIGLNGAANRVAGQDGVAANTAVQGEQQRPTQVLKGVLHRS